jgi:hypothetical protein
MTVWIFTAYEISGRANWMELIIPRLPRLAAPGGRDNI